MIIDGLTSKTISFTAGVATPEFKIDRSKNPFGYWIVMAIYCGCFGFVTYKILSYIPNTGT